ncbi:MAG: hypothetical protein P0Y53_15190 [Candidatus Pseudobacter hemicellulosilyticus]|uniref:Uncharacterized protein n=1 Tax=Candidatus Pseudobacter hemicellulosilyticus TaxID=3121375 RepID=A0AAJ5WL10_9BACT|nr:MAG: hypothetical protein P0Y53_15190 [Pseudobacter sp.]
MKKIFFPLILLCLTSTLHAQHPSVYTIKADSVKITNSPGIAELILENNTKDIPGFLLNKGRGRTIFKRPSQLNDSTLVIGNDTFLIRGSARLWTVSGNAGTDPANDFLGTFNNVGFTVRANNMPKLGFARDARPFQLTATGMHMPTGAISLTSSSAASTEITFGATGIITTTDTVTTAGTIFPLGTSNAQASSGSMNGLNITGQLLDTAGDGNYTAFLISGSIDQGAQGTGIVRGLYLNETINNANHYHALEVARGKTVLKDTLTLSTGIAKSDTASYKPVAADAAGNFYKMTAWNTTVNRKSASVTGSSYSIPADIDVVLVNYAAGQATITLPIGTLDREITIKNLSNANTVVLSGLDASETGSIGTHGTITVKYTGDAWVGISKY